MGRTLDLGRRIELVSMDRHFHDITIGLYERPGPDGPAFHVHTYSQKPGAPERTAFIDHAMQTLGGLTPASEGHLHFPCGERHLLGVRRVFLDAWKLPSSMMLQAHSLSVRDKKCDSTLTAEYRDNGIYEIVADSDGEEVRRRLTVYARGLLKLAGLNEVPNQVNAVEFPCKQPHHALVGLLMIRAGDVRTAMREAAMMSARGVLASPSNQPGVSE